MYQFRTSGGVPPSLDREAMQRFRDREKDRKIGVAAAKARGESIFAPLIPAEGHADDVFQPMPTALTATGTPVFEAVLANTQS